MRTYEAPELFVDEYVADTMIASSGEAKNGNPNNQNCFGCDSDPYDIEGHAYCTFYPADGGFYDDFCR